MGQNISKEADIAALLGQWSVTIRQDEREAAAIIHEQLKEHIADISRDFLITYLLLECRFYLMQKDLPNSTIAIAEAKAYRNHFHDSHWYSLHVAQGILYHYEDRYQEALHSFEKAEKYLFQLEEPVEIGEFHLRKAMTYFYLDITALSTLHAERAIEAFRPHKTFEFLLAHAEMLQGLNYIDLHHFDQAQDYLHRALTSFKKLRNTNFIASTNLNFGVLYSKRDSPSTAIPFLEEALRGNQERIRLKILYLLADCYWKTGQTSKARRTYQEGFRASIEKDDAAKKWEFAMLHKKYEDRLNFESVWQEGIEYFRKINDTYNVRRFSKELAHYYDEHKQHELAVKYYSLALLL
ncbi:tetratricopeptide repeat protein [Terribacillus saccharophilus]|uniref:tetratricopeptide repeat protein n=1 Tax=Terribacillus saccharophilus TaxID=361277 RepID=UPI003982CDD2